MTRNQLIKEYKQRIMETEIFMKTTNWLLLPDGVQKVMQRGLASYEATLKKLTKIEEGEEVE